MSSNYRSFGGLPLLALQAVISQGVNPGPAHFPLPFPWRQKSGHLGSPAGPCPSQPRSNGAT